MTVNISASPESTELDQPSVVNVGHPVRNFLLTIAALAALLGALWWTGAVTPRVDLTDPAGIVDSCSHRATVRFGIVNAAPFSVRVDAVQLQLDGFVHDRIVADGVSTSTRQRAPRLTVGGSLS